MSCNKKKVIVYVIHRFPSQNNDEFNSFLSNFEKLLSNTNKLKPSLFVVTGDFNALSSVWWCNDINATEESKLFSLTSSNGFSQIINDPAHKQTAIPVLI